jgi:hypothetical protein
MTNTTTACVGNNISKQEFEDFIKKCTETKFYIIGTQEKLDLIKDSDLPLGVKKKAISSDYFEDSDKVFIIPVNDNKPLTARFE